MTPAVGVNMPRLTSCRPRNGSRSRLGFTLFEVILAMFVVLMGLMGIIATFSVGMKAQVIAQELVISQELATMWADWIRFRLNDAAGATTPHKLTTADLKVGARGDFYKEMDTGGVGVTYTVGGGDPSDLPLYNRGNGVGTDIFKYDKGIYAGYEWEIKALLDAKGNAAGTGSYVPQWIPTAVNDLSDKSAGLKDWTQNMSGGGTYPPAVGALPVGLTQVTLVIRRYGREYSFNYTFSGCGLKY